MEAEKSYFNCEDLSKYRGVLMGLQALLIVFFHFTETCKSYDVHFSGFISFYYTYIRSSGVDVFLLLSGMGLYFSWKKHPDYKSFLSKRLRKILPAYFMVAIPVWVWLDFVYFKTGVIDFLKDLFFVTFFTDGTRTYWYVLLIIICYLIFPFFYRIVEGSKDKVSELMNVLTICTSLTLFTVMIQLYHSTLYKTISLALFRMPFFIIGILIGKYVYEKRKIPKHHIYVMLGMAILFLGPLDFANVKILGFYFRALLNLSFCFLLVLFLGYLSRKKNKLCTGGYKAILKTLNWFGKYTYEIYLVHISVRRIMNLLGYEICYIKYVPVWLLLSLVLSVVLKKICQYC